MTRFAPVAVLVAVFAGGATVTPPRLVVSGPGSNEGPAAGSGWLAWMHSATPNPLPPASHTVVRVRQGKAAPWQANPPGTYAQTGGIDGQTLVLQLIRGGRSKLAVLDLGTRKLTRLPFEARSPAWLWRPSISGPWIQYGRIDYATGTYSIVITNRTSGVSHTLAAVNGHAAYAAPGQVNGRYAVWIGCPDNHCRAYRYDIKSHRQIAMPLLGGYQYSQFGPSVSRDGTVYYGNARACGDVRLVRWHNGTSRTILRFPANTAFQYSYADRGAVYYDQVGCNRSDLSSIYRIRG